MNNFVEEVRSEAPVRSEKPIWPGRNGRWLAGEVSRISDVDIGLCWHCKCCSGGCPFSAAMDYHPNQVVRMVQLGMPKEVLTCSAIWICVGCHTCSMECPTGIDMASVMDALRQISLREGVSIAEPDILNFHREVINSMYRHGRAHKLEIMMRYKLRTRRWLEDMNVGLRMLSKRKLDLRPSKVRNLGAIRRLFSKNRGAAR